MPSPEHEQQPPQTRRNRTLLWSALGTILLLPGTAFIFLRVFDAGSTINVSTVILFPILILQWQGVLTGLFVNVALVASTFFPVYFMAKRISGFRSDHEPATGSRMSRPASDPSPLSVRLLAICDFIGGVIIAVSVIDYPLVSLAALVVLWPAAWGLFRGRVWGWWAGMVLHSLIVIGLFCVYGWLLFLGAQDLGRPRGHMELISTEAAMVILTVVFVSFELIAIVPLIMLSRQNTRHCFSRA